MKAIITGFFITLLIFSPLIYYCHFHKNIISKEILTVRDNAQCTKRVFSHYNHMYIGKTLHLQPVYTTKQFTGTETVYLVKYDDGSYSQDVVCKKPREEY